MLTAKINFLSLSLVVPASFFKIACIKIKSTAVEALFHLYTGPEVESTESFTKYIKNQFFSRTKFYPLRFHKDIQVKNLYPNRTNFKLLLSSPPDNSLFGKKPSKFMFCRNLRMWYALWNSVICYYFAQQDHVQSVHSHVPELLVNWNDHMPHIFKVISHFNCLLSIYSPQLYNTNFVINR